MPDPDLGFVHRFEPGRPSVRPLLLLHGTGGDETDLLPLGRMVAPGAALLSPRGPVLENGMPRFFRRLAEGVFDEADVRRRAADLAGFVAAARARYGLAAPLALGFSNGANIAAATLLLHPEALAGAVLLRAMVPLSEPPPAGLAGRPVLMLSGAADPIVPGDDAARLAALLQAAGARVEHAVLPAGHGLTPADVARIGSWMAEEAPPRRSGGRVPPAAGCSARADAIPRRLLRDAEPAYRERDVAPRTGGGTRNDRGHCMAAELAERLRLAAAAGRRHAETFVAPAGADALPWAVVAAFDAEIRGSVERDRRIEDERDRVLIAAVNLAESRPGDGAEAIDAARDHLLAAIDYLEQAVLRFGVVNRVGARRGFGTAGIPCAAKA